MPVCSSFYFTFMASPEGVTKQIQSHSWPSAHKFRKNGLVQRHDSQHSVQEHPRIWPSLCSKLNHNIQKVLLSICRCKLERLGVRRGAHMQAPTSLYLSECSMMLLLLKVLEGPFLLVTSSICCWQMSVSQ